MKKLPLAFITVLTLYSCCQEFCDDQRLLLWGRDLPYTAVDTFFVIRYKPGTNFTERIDTLKRYMLPPSSTSQPVSFFESLESSADWKIVIPALSKEYFISNIETAQQRCNCEPGSYKTVTRFRLNNTTIEGSSADLN